MILTTIAIVAQASPAPVASPSATVAESAKAWFLSLQAGKILDSSALTDAMRAGLTPELVSKTATILQPLGAPKAFTQISTGTQSGSTYYVYKVGFKSGDAVDFIYAVDGTGKISGLRVTPAH